MFAGVAPPKAIIRWNSATFIPGFIVSRVGFIVESRVLGGAPFCDGTMDGFLVGRTARTSAALPFIEVVNGGGCFTSTDTRALASRIGFTWLALLTMIGWDAITFGFVLFLAIGGRIAPVPPLISVGTAETREGGLVVLG
jgi:hypothetical protein